MKNDIEVRKHSKQRKTSVHDESRTIVHIYKHKITDDKDEYQRCDREGDKIVTLPPV